MDFYTKNQEDLRNFLKRKYKKKDDEKDEVYEKAINA